MRSESSNYTLGSLDKVLVLKFVLKPINPDTEFKMVCGQTIKIGGKKLRDEKHFNFESDNENLINQILLKSIGFPQFHAYP